MATKLRSSSCAPDVISPLPLAVWHSFRQPGKRVVKLPPKRPRRIAGYEINRGKVRDSLTPKDDFRFSEEFPLTALVLKALALD